MIINGYGRWLGYLFLQGELHTQEQPGARATEARVRAYLAFLRGAGLADFTQAKRLQELGDALKVIAPNEDFSWVRKAAWRIHGCAEPSRDLRSRLRPADEVLQLGLDIMEAAEQDRFRTPTERACLFRDGLLISFLTLRPIRSGNLAALCVERELERRGAEWWVEFEECQGKTRRLLEFPWPAQQSIQLDRYLEIHRPRLQGCSRRGAPTKALWVSKQGTGMTSSALSYQLKARTKEEFGEAINPHSFRHIAATTIATVDPENATFIAAVLGHSGAGSSDRYYNRARTVDAGRRYQAVLSQARKR